MRYRANRAVLIRAGRGFTGTEIGNIAGFTAGIKPCMPRRLHAVREVDVTESKHDLQDHREQREA